ncbi:MAG: glycosyltransferase [Xenococcaceae cyanobacterium MO_188.B29]|nr:glycosyltransferase [Xenococcaceae cyanobacterium MO_188.B29]
MVSTPSQGIDLSQQVDYLHTQAVEQHKQGNLVQAVKFYQDAIALPVQQPAWIYGNLVTLLAQLEQVDAAISIGKQGIKLHQDTDEIYRALGIALEAKGSLTESVDSYCQAITLNSEQPDWLYSNLTEQLVQQQRLDEAIAIAQQGLQLYPEFYCLYYYLGEALANQEKWDEAIAAYLRTQELNPDFLEVEQKLNYALYQRVQLERQVTSWQSYQAINQDFSTIDHQAKFKTPSSNTESNSDSTILTAKTKILKDKSINAEAIFLAENILILKILGDINLKENCSISLDDKIIDNYLSWISLKHTSADCCLLLISDPRLEEIKTLENLSIRENIHSHCWKLEENAIKLNQTENIAEFLKPILSDAYPEFFSWIIKIVKEFPHSDRLDQVCQLLREHFQGSQLIIDYSCWLTPSIIYLEGTVQDLWVLNEAEILAFSSSHCEVASGEFFQISHQQFAAVAVFDRDVYTSSREVFYLNAYYNEKTILLAGQVAEKAYSLEFIDRLNDKPEYQKHLIRENISRNVIKLIPENLQSAAGNLLSKLQYFLKVPPLNFTDKNLPFKIFLDYIIPIKCEGLFLSGWLQDPYNMLEEVKAISALGFTLSLPNEQIYRIERRDVSEYLRNTRYGNFAGKLGFCAYLQVPTEISRKFENFAELHSFRFQIKLKGNIEIEIIPDVQYSDVYAARKLIMQIAPPAKVDEQMLENCIAPAARRLQQLCISKVKIKQVSVIGKPVAQPLVSIIIPLYRRLDFMKVQFATMANDPAMKQCELIYVLDSPEQEEELKQFLLDHCTLYQLPVTLVVMEHNSGYAAANNTGVAQARGEYIVLMNSDVFPQTKAWTLKMAQFYNSSPQIGTLAPKLIYEDCSLQHAGMFFAKTTFPFWITLHYYKGMPSNYELALVNRRVPAVTGACLMMRKELYEEVGGLATDYVIGDFEDSDLCLKCAELGYESWYFAEAALYHLERQSVPLNSVYSGSLAWQLNGRLHNRRWHNQIEKLMSIYQ